MVTMNIFNPQTGKWEVVHSDFSKSQLESKMDKIIIDKLSGVGYSLEIIDGELFLKTNK